MSNDPENGESGSKTSLAIGTGLAMGVGAGVAIGVALNNLAIGIAIGMAAHLFVDAFFSLADVAYIPGTFLFDKAWLIVNGLFCFGLAVLAGRK